MHPNPPPEDQNAPNRKRGAPAGNINALKDGFYSERFRKSEIEDLLQLPANSLKGEIAILRVITRRITEALENCENSEALLPYYDTISVMCIRLATLLKAEKAIQDQEDAVHAIMDSLSTALKRLRDELGISPPEIP